MFQSEHFDSRNGTATNRRQVVPRFGVGLSLIVKRVVIRSTLVNDNGPNYSLAGWHNFAAIQVKAGFRY